MLQESYEEFDLEDTRDRQRALIKQSRSDPIHMVKPTVLTKLKSMMIWSAPSAGKLQPQPQFCIQPAFLPKPAHISSSRAFEKVQKGSPRTSQTRLVDAKM